MQKEETWQWTDRRKDTCFTVRELKQGSTALPYLTPAWNVASGNSNFCHFVYICEQPAKAPGVLILRLQIHFSKRSNLVIMKVGCILFWQHLHFQRCFQCMWVGSWEATGFLQTSSHGWLLTHSELPTPIPGERSGQVAVPWGLGWAESSTSRKSQRPSKVVHWAKVKAKELKTGTLKCSAPTGVGGKVNMGSP